MQADKIPDEIMREAECVEAVWSNNGTAISTRTLLVDAIARALMARDKRAVEIARRAFSHGLPGGAAEVIAAAILTYGGRDADH